MGRFIPARAGNTCRSSLSTEREYRFIPARAGNTFPASRRCASLRTVHPRAGGEHPLAQVVTRVRQAGSSPRGRGTRRHGERLHREDHRFIPARAGNTASRAAHSGSNGSSPRGRGTRDSRSRRGASGMTVHPRAGGEHVRCGSNSRSATTRFIPARAGNTPRARAVRLRRKCHGSSPRGRGTPLSVDGSPRIGIPGDRFIPARAGNTCSQGRGACVICRFIPARAGNTLGELPMGAVVHTVHPRAGGEHSRSRRRAATAPRFIPARAGNTETPGRHSDLTELSGSSPRGRGTPRRPAELPITTPVHPRAGGEHTSAAPRRLG